MKLKTVILAAIALLAFLAGSGAAYAQSAPKSNFDTDIWKIRNNCMPGFRYHYDDYLQYAPAAVMAGMKAFGYESRTKWYGMLVAA